MSGQTIEFTAADLEAAAAAYDPAKWQAPIVIGHPTLDAPAYGWVKRIDHRDGDLYAEADQVEPAFAELVRAGRYKRVSAAWFTPGHPRNPTPGVYYLKHLGFLGAAAPAVPGLKPVEFGLEADDLVIEFGAANVWSVKRVFRALREWLLEREGAKAADRIVPEHEIESLELPQESAVRPAFAQPANEGDAMSEADKARLAALEAENAALKARIAEAERLERHAAHAAFAEAQVKAGRMTPAMRDVIVAALDALAGMPEPVQFGDGEARVPLIDALKSALAAAPVVVDFAEHSAAGEDAAAVADFAAPAQHAVDATALDLHRRALAWQAAHPGVDYLTAVKAVSTAA